MSELPEKVATLLVRLEDGDAWLSTVQSRFVQPDVHPSTLRTAKQRGLVREVNRRGPPKPAVLLRLTPKGLEVAEEIE